MEGWQQPHSVRCVRETNERHWSLVRAGETFVEQETESKPLNTFWTSCPAQRKQSHYSSGGSQYGYSDENVRMTSSSSSRRTEQVLFESKSVGILYNSLSFCP